MGNGVREYVLIGWKYCLHSYWFSSLIAEFDEQELVRRWASCEHKTYSLFMSFHWIEKANRVECLGQDVYELAAMLFTNPSHDRYVH